MGTRKNKIVASDSIILINMPERPTSMRKLALLLVIIEFLGASASCAIPYWVKVTYSDQDDVVGGLFYSCSSKNCYIHDYYKHGWIKLCQALYILGVISSLIAGVFAIIAVSVRKHMTTATGACTFFVVVSLGFQLAAIGLYGDHVSSQKMCIFRQTNNKPRTICTGLFAHANMDIQNEDTLSFGWSYWLAVVVVVIKLVNMLVGYAIVNEDVFHTVYK